MEMDIKTRYEHQILYATTETKLKYIKLISGITRFIRSIMAKKNQISNYSKNGLVWNLDLREGIDFCLFATGEYEPDVVKSYQRMIKDDDIIIDIGANIGAHTLNMAKKVTRGHIYSFEATNFAYKKLIKNISLNPVIAKNITTYKAFVTSDLKDHCPELLSSSWDISKAIDHRERNPLDKGFAHSTLGAQVITLDHWMNANNIKKVDLIKIDVDGYEVEVLKGAKKLLSTLRPKIIIELSPIHFKGMKYSFKDQIKLLKDYGYKIEDVYGSDIPLDANYLEKWIPHGTLVNVIAKPIS